MNNIEFSYSHIVCIKNVAFSYATLLKIEWSISLIGFIHCFSIYKRECFYPVINIERCIFIELSKNPSSVLFFIEIVHRHGIFVKNQRKHFAAIFLFWSRISTIYSHAACSICEIFLNVSFKGAHHRFYGYVNLC